MPHPTSAVRAGQKPGQPTLPQTLLAIGAWMLGPGRGYQHNAWLNCVDWTIYAAFLGHPTGLRKSSALQLAGQVSQAQKAVRAHGWLDWNVRGIAQSITPAGQAELAALGEPAARLAACLDALAGHLPLTNNVRSLYWYAVCACWLSAEAVAGRQLTETVHAQAPRFSHGDSMGSCIFMCNRVI